MYLKCLDESVASRSIYPPADAFTIAEQKTLCALYVEGIEDMHCNQIFDAL